uniref:Uncharacterized protein n=1 Tax=Glossina palpalis gambiensis TaxID=67801 RepID=A0A1B0BHW9_9MUSC
MSMFFFRLHNLQRAEETKRKKRVEHQRLRQRQRRGAKVFRSVVNSTGHLTLAPSRLFEKTPMSPSDSLDEIALQIPRRRGLKDNVMQIAGIIVICVAAGVIPIMIMKLKPTRPAAPPSSPS